MSSASDGPPEAKGGGVLPALRTVHGLRGTRILAYTIALLLGAVIVALVFVPWQQNARGSGRVVAFDPYNRTQTIAAAVSGRVGKAWVLEGSQVKKERSV